MSFSAQLPVFETLRKNFILINKMRHDSGMGTASYIEELVSLLTELIDCAKKGDEKRAEELATSVQSKIKEFTN